MHISIRLIYKLIVYFFPKVFLAYCLVDFPSVCFTQAFLVYLLLQIRMPHPTCTLVVPWFVLTSCHPGWNSGSSSTPHTVTHPAHHAGITKGKVAFQVVAVSICFFE